MVAPSPAPTYLAYAPHLKLTFLDWLAVPWKGHWELGAETGLFPLTLVLGFFAGWYTPPKEDG